MFLLLRKICNTDTRTHKMADSLFRFDWIEADTDLQWIDVLPFGNVEWLAFTATKQDNYVCCGNGFLIALHILYALCVVCCACGFTSIIVGVGFHTGLSKLETSMNTS